MSVSAETKKQRDRDVEGEKQRVVIYLVRRAHRMSSGNTSVRESIASPGSLASSLGWLGTEESRGERERETNRESVTQLDRE
ncbi:unnamed protein product [Ilex paraguariensis]|uniref:Uncharacterized protein n=1 Tax=Ilex paraguariensis TaxID=185542 RepID=A0ABC8UF55_9AQUA